MKEGDKDYYLNALELKARLSKTKFCWNQCLLTPEKEEFIQKNNVGSPVNIILDVWSGCIDFLEYFDIKIIKSERFQDCFRKVYTKSLDT